MQNNRQNIAKCPHCGALVNIKYPMCLGCYKPIEAFNKKTKETFVKYSVFIGFALILYVYFTLMYLDYVLH